MVDKHFDKYLSSDGLEKIRKEQNFRNTYPIEQFVMDFETLTHIQEYLPDCVVKGGMAVPFHLTDKKLHRLSVDIDIVTSRSREEVIEVMKKLSTKLNGFVTIGEPHVPTRRSENKELPLLTYYCTYTSSVEDNPEIKIEIFHSNDLKIKSTRIIPPRDVIGISIDFPLSVYDHATLIGDKLTTLPFNTIGINPERELDVPKQIYDVGRLLGAISESIPIQDIIESFEKISNDEISYYIKDKPTFDHVLDDLAQFSNNILEIGKTLRLNKSYDGRLNKFITELLGRNGYQARAHISDILLIRLLAILMIRHFREGLDHKIISSILEKALTVLRDISQTDSKAQTKLLRSIIVKHGKRTTEGELIKTMFVEQAVLYDLILESEKIGIKKAE